MKNIYQKYPSIHPTVFLQFGGEAGAANCRGKAIKELRQDQSGVMMLWYLPATAAGSLYKSHFCLLSRVLFILWCQGDATLQQLWQDLPDVDDLPNEVCQLLHEENEQIFSAPEYQNITRRMNCDVIVGKLILAKTQTRAAAIDYITFFKKKDSTVIEISETK